MMMIQNRLENQKRQEREEQAPEPGEQPEEAGTEDQRGTGKPCKDPGKGLSRLRETTTDRANERWIHTSCAFSPGYC